MASSSDLAHYRALVHKTASLIVADVPLEFDDIVQMLWIKVWWAVDHYSRERANGMPRDGYVFMCLKDKVKDITRKRWRPELFLEQLRLDSEDKFDEEHMAVSEDVVFFEVEDEPLQLPNTLTADERGVIDLLLAGYRQAEAARSLGWPPSRMERTMRTIRVKLEDWRPAGADSAPAELPIAA